MAFSPCQVLLGALLELLVTEDPGNHQERRGYFFLPASPVGAFPPFGFFLPPLLPDPLSGMMSPFGRRGRAAGRRILPCRQAQPNIPWLGSSVVLVGFINGAGATT